MEQMDIEWASGIGYDVHRLKKGRKLILGGVHIEHERGLEGHSDADVMLHALADALLGAAGLADIGNHFPPNDDRWKDADSMDLLRRVVALIGERGWQVGNVDMVLVAEKPRIAPYRGEMVSGIAVALGIDEHRVGVKATTNEGLGTIGREEGMAAWATTMLWRYTR